MAFSFLFACLNFIYLATAKKKKSSEAYDKNNVIIQFNPANDHVHNYSLLGYSWIYQLRYQQKVHIIFKSPKGIARYLVRLFIESQHESTDTLYFVTL
jgi:hypothetical protein